MRELAGRNDVREPVAVDVADRDVLCGTGFGAVGQRRERPSIGIRAAERDADMSFGRAIVLIVRLVNRDDVDEPVAVEIRGRKTVAAAQR